MAGYATPEKYTEMIQALQTFGDELLQACDKMNQCGQVCQAATGSDKISQNAIAQLNEAIKKFHAVQMKVVELEKKLGREREEVVRIMRESEGV